MQFALLRLEGWFHQQLTLLAWRFSRPSHPNILSAPRSADVTEQPSARTCSGKATEAIPRRSWALTGTAPVAFAVMVGLPATALSLVVALQLTVGTFFPQSYWTERLSWMLRPAVIDADHALVGFLPPAHASDLDAAHAVAADVIPEHCVDLVLAREDAHQGQWWRHARGIDFGGIFRAAVTLRGGASTLPMQLARQLSGWQARHNSVTRKVLEWGSAQQLLDLHHGDYRALAKTYLAVVPFARAHGDVRGLGAAADAFFSKPASALSAGECAFLVVLLPTRPSLISDTAAAAQAWEVRRQQAVKLLDGQALHREAAVVAAWLSLPPLRPDIVGLAAAATLNVGARTRALVVPHLTRISNDLTDDLPGAPLSPVAASGRAEQQP